MTSTFIVFDVFSMLVSPFHNSSFAFVKTFAKKGISSALKYTGNS